MSTVRAVRLGGISRAGWYRKSTAKDQSALRLRIREIALSRHRFGYERIHIVLRREGWKVNHKRVHRVKLLVHDGIGIWLRARRLHQGRFSWTPPDVGSRMSITMEQLQALVIGLPWQRLGEHATIRML